MAEFSTACCELYQMRRLSTDGRARGIESGAVNGGTINVYKNYLIPQRVDCGVSNIKVNAAISTAD